jgi:hypothetical protein
MNIFILAKYFSLEALPASRLDAGDVDNLEYQVPYDWLPAGRLDAGDWMPAGHLDVGDKQTRARSAT